MTTPLDPLTLAVIQAGLQQVCNEMDIAFTRSAFSPVIAEADDRSSGLYDRDTGALIAQGELGLPVFVGTMQHSTAEILRLVREGKAGAPEPGDVYIVNDPYLGGTHLMDVRFARPFYHRGELFCWLQNTGHWPDVGGMVPGGFSAHATEVEQEGLRLPPVKLFKRGVMDAEIYAIITSNIRIADQRIGDIRAQAAALEVGERRLTELLDRYGRETVEQAISEIRARAAQFMRAQIAAIPDGIYRSEAFVDSDGVVNEPLRIVLAVEKQGETPALRLLRLLAALPGADELGLGDDLLGRLPRHAAHLPGDAAQRGRLRPAATWSAGGHLPRRPLSAPRVRLRGGGVAARRRGGVPGAGQAMPDKVTAAPAGSSGNFALGGFDPRRGTGYVMYQISGGGYGGNADHDGHDPMGAPPSASRRPPPVEVTEQLYPVLFRRFGLREGSGGAGRHRGGFGVHYDVEILRGEAAGSFVMDHGRFGPPGVLGGKDGAPNVVRIHRGGTVTVPEHLSKDQGIRLAAGDRVEVMTPGGGGYGPPEERDPAAIARDLERGYYTREQALALWGRTGEEDAHG